MNCPLILFSHRISVNSGDRQTLRFDTPLDRVNRWGEKNTDDPIDDSRLSPVTHDASFRANGVTIDSAVRETVAAMNCAAPEPSTRARRACPARCAVPKVLRVSGTTLMRTRLTNTSPPS